MKLRLQCKGPQDKDWCNLSSEVYPMGHSDAALRDQRKTELRMDSIHQGWLTYFGTDYAFRIIKAR